nr:NADH dehydrogenase subunit 2 [Artheneis intricata]
MHQKKMFFLILLLGTLMTASSNNWLMMWMGMEINLMAFIPIVSSPKNLKSSQASMIYFLTQSIGSTLLLFSLLFMSKMFNNPWMFNSDTYYLLMMSIFIKVGMAPFHSWLPEMMSNMNWINCIMLMTWQKIAPLMIINNLNMNNYLCYLVIMMSAMIGAIGGINLTSLRKMMAYSSINHMSWIVLTLSIQAQWYKYLIIYSAIITPMLIMFNMNNIYFINQLVNNSYSMTTKLSYSSLMLSMGGLPPFLGFMPKWIAIQAMINSNLMSILIIMILFSMLTLFYYLRIINSMLLMYSYKSKWLINLKLWNYLEMSVLLLNLLLPVATIMIFY